jgi:uncharacterized protein YbcI
VKTTRQAFQMTMRERFSQAVEEIMGRTVVGFMSQVHLDPDMAAEIFVLAPEGDDQAPEASFVSVVAESAAEGRSN